MKFTIEQIAIAPKDPAAAKELLMAMGAADWVEDHVTAAGFVRGVEERKNEADLQFNYSLVSGKEFEILHYTTGDNWIAHLAPCVSHLGMHCSSNELVQWRAFFATRAIPVVQEVFTTNHTNPSIAGKRHYQYVIFGTRAILGVDLKFIIRFDRA